MTFLFKRTGDGNYPRSLKIMVMGPPKSGKTSFIATAPNVVIASCEAGLMSVAHLNIPYVDIEEASHLETLFLVLKDDALRKKAAEQLGLPDIETVAIDTLDAYQEILKKQILKEARRTEMQQADWGKLKERMAAILKAFCALPLNVIFTVHTDVTQDENSKQIYAPLLQGSIKNEVAGYVDFSLMSGREKQTLPDGTQKIVYFLKNEGDEKNPHLGNRGAGRVPEISTPDFRELHRLVFDAINLPKTASFEVDSSPTDSEEVAISRSHPVAAEVTSPAPSGTPQDDSGNPVNAAGVQAVTKAYESMGLTVPGDLQKWTLGEARKIAKVFAVMKAEIAAGRAAKSDLVKALTQEGRYEGEAQRQTAGVKKVAVAKKAAEVKSAPAAAETPATTEEAVANVEKQLGGSVVGFGVEEGAPCQTCDKPVDDLEVARLAQSRFQKVLCKDDYLAVVAKAAEK